MSFIACEYTNHNHQPSSFRAYKFKMYEIDIGYVPIDAPILFGYKTLFLTLRHYDQVVSVHLQSSRPCQHREK